MSEEHPREGRIPLRGSFLIPWAPEASPGLGFSKGNGPNLVYGDGQGSQWLQKIPRHPSMDLLDLIRVPYREP